jgi:hypothetical protein
MKLSEWANVAEIVSAVAIIGSLVYIAVQIDQTKVAIEASTQQGRQDFGRNQAELLITEPGLAKFVIEAEKDAKNLTEEEQLRFYEFTSWRLATWENSYIANIEGIMAEEMWLSWDGYYRLLVEGKPGYIQFFEDTRPQWDARFMKHVDEIISEQK